MRLFVYHSLQHVAMSSKSTPLIFLPRLVDFGVDNPHKMPLGWLYCDQTRQLPFGICLQSVSIQALKIF